MGVQALPATAARNDGLLQVTTTNGRVGGFYRGGAALAVAARRPIVVVAHNAARCWPPHRLAKHAGTIHVAISPPIEVAGRDVDALTLAARQWMIDAMARLPRD